MRKFISIIGFIFVFVYLVFTITAWASAYNCSGMFCQLVVFVPIMPWVFITDIYSNWSINFYLLLVGLSSLILYSIGYLAGLIIKKIIVTRRINKDNN